MNGDQILCGYCELCFAPPTHTHPKSRVAPQSTRFRGEPISRVLAGTRATRHVGTQGTRHVKFPPSPGVRHPQFWERGLDASRSVDAGVASRKKDHSVERPFLTCDGDRVRV